MQRWVGVLLAAFLLAGCHDKASLEVKESDGAKVSVSLPQGLTAAELIQICGILDNSLTVRAERNVLAYQSQQAQILAQQAQAARRDYLALARFAIVCLSLAASVIGCFGIRYAFKRGGRP